MVQEAVIDFGRGKQFESLQSLVALQVSQEGEGTVENALVGVSDLVVVHTEDATLVVPKDRAQDVREVVAQLKKRGAESLL